MKKIKQKVESILLSYPETRDNDWDLLFRYWYEFNGVALTPEQKIKIKSWPSVHSILRNRAYIQNEEGKFKGKEETQIARQQAELQYKNDYRIEYWMDYQKEKELTKEEKLERFREIQKNLEKKGITF